MGVIDQTKSLVGNIKSIISVYSCVLLKQRSFYEPYLQNITTTFMIHLNVESDTIAVSKLSRN